MMLIETYLDKSPIHGIGAFTTHFVPKGTKVWEYTPGLDLMLSDDTVERLPKVQCEAVLHYSYRVAQHQIILCCDNARHFNFSATPNTMGTLEGVSSALEEFVSYACRDIEEGEELTFSVLEDMEALARLGPELYSSLL